MSFILDALKKSETDRQRQSSPALFEVKVAQPRRKFPVWAAALAVLLGVNVLALAWVLLRRSDAPPAAAGRAGARRRCRAWRSERAPTGHGDRAGHRDDTDHGEYPDRPERAQRRQSAWSAPAARRRWPTEPLLEGQEPAVPPDYDARDYRPAITPEQAGAIAAARRSGALPSRDEVLAQGNQLPDLRLDLHVYDANPAKRFVFINMRKLREGESLPEGVRVDQITPTGAELSYRGKRFTLDGN